MIRNEMTKCNPKTHQSVRLDLKNLSRHIEVLVLKFVICIQGIVLQTETRFRAEFPE